MAVNTLVRDVNDSDFDEVVLADSRPVLVDFYADWCPPCKLLEPILDQLSTELHGKVTFTRLNVDDNEDASVRFGILDMPTLILFEGGEEVSRIHGYLPRERLLKQLEQTFGI